MAPVGDVAGEKGHPNVQPSAPLGATHMVPLPIHGLTVHRRSRAALIALLVLVVPVSAYYVIRNSAQLELWLGMSGTDRGTRTADQGRPPSSSPPAKIRVAPSSAPALGSGTAGVSNAGPAAIEASAESTSQISSANVAKAAPDTKQPAASRVDAARPPYARPTTRSFAVAAPLPEPRATASKGRAPPDAPRVSVCTEGVAALGFCEPNPQGKSN